MTPGALYFSVMFFQVFSTPFLLLHLFLRFCFPLFLQHIKRILVCNQRYVRPVQCSLTLTQSFSAVCFVTPFCTSLPVKEIVHPKWKFCHNLFTLKLMLAIDFHSIFFHTMVSMATVNWLPTLPSFVLQRRKKLIQVWYNLRVSSFLGEISL